MKFFWLFFLCLPAFAFQAKYEFAEFSQAESSPNFLRFDMDSKKMGLFKAKVTGFVKKFEASGDLKGQQLKDAVVRFKVRDLTTDLYARDDNLWNLCLDNKNHDTLEFRVKEAKLSPGQAVTVPAEALIRGKAKPVELTLTLEKKEGREIVSGKGVFSLEKLEIPDPSIGVANVSDEFTVSFQIEGQ